ncbi:MAG: DUF362 domain-containing protein [Deltaproteobacteria bacterium]|nr:DUF362 domain-containing protein [Deltaproteobacteria bacterium]
MDDAVTRREFLSTSGAAVAGATVLAAAGCTTPERRAPTPIDVATGATRAASPKAVRVVSATVTDERARAVARAGVAQAKHDDPAAVAHALLTLIAPSIGDGPVFIKPNLNFNSKDFAAGRLKPAHLAPVTVSPRFIEGVLDYFRERGVPYSRMAVGEGFGYRTTANGVIQFLGIDALCRKRGAQTVDLNAARAVNVKLASARTMTEIDIAEPVWNAFDRGVLVSCAKLKTHRYPVTTLTLKNMMGAILPYNQKWRMHAELVQGFKRGAIRRSDYFTSLDVFSSRLTDFCALTPHVALVDGGVCGEGDGLNVEREGGLTNAVPLGVGFGGLSSVNVDAVASAFIGFPGENPSVPGFPELRVLPWLAEPARRGYGFATATGPARLGAKLAPPPRFRYTCKYRLV